MSAGRTFRAAAEALTTATNEFAAVLRDEAGEADRRLQLQTVDPAADYDALAVLIREAKAETPLNPATFSDCWTSWLRLRYVAELSVEDATAFLRAGLRAGIVNGPNSALAWAQAVSRGSLGRDELRTIAEGS